MKQLKASTAQLCVAGISLLTAGTILIQASDIGQEVAISRHLADGEEFSIPINDLVEHGRQLFIANWTIQEGAGRPLSKGTADPLSNPSHPLVFPRNFNRVSGPDGNSCFGCHNAPHGIAGGGGDVVANVFALGQRFDFATFDREDTEPTAGAVDERSEPVSLQTIANSRATLGMFGSGFVEMLARQMTSELQAIRDETQPGTTNSLVTKGVTFGAIKRLSDGSWDTSQVEGIPAASLEVAEENPPSLIVRPFHQVGTVVSLREFSNNAFNHHHGIQSTERFGAGADPDGDGFSDEMTRADVTAVSVFQATLAVPGRVIPNDPEVEDAVLIGEAKFQEVGCTDCHVPSLPLDRDAYSFTEPNPYNPTGNLQPDDAETLAVDLTSDVLPPPRLKRNAGGVVHVPAFTDMKLHDITSGPDDPNREPLDMQHPSGSDAFFAGNGKFLTRKLWDVGNKPNHYHHGLYTTLRESIAAHAGEALASRQAFDALTEHERDCIIEFLKTLQVLPPGTTHLIVDETGAPKVWPPNRVTSIAPAGVHLVAVSWQGGTGLGTTPRIYQLQHCADLGTGVWEDLGTPTLQTSSTNTTTHRQGFYRVVLLP